jgi:hypothetical protein
LFREIQKYTEGVGHIEILLLGIPIIKKNPTLIPITTQICDFKIEVKLIRFFNLFLLNKIKVNMIEISDLV